MPTFIFAPVVVANPPRAQYYDRALTSTGIFFEGNGLAPHGATIRATYTTPSNRKAFVGGGSLSLNRATAATTPAPAAVSSQVGPNLIGEVRFNANAVGDKMVVGISSGATILAGLTAIIQDVDGSTGGTIDVAEALHIEEFDA